MECTAPNDSSSAAKPTPTASSGMLSETMPTAAIASISVGVLDGKLSRKNAMSSSEAMTAGNSATRAVSYTHLTLPTNREV